MRCEGTDMVISTGSLLGFEAVPCLISRGINYAQPNGGNS